MNDWENEEFQILKKKDFEGKNFTERLHLFLGILVTLICEIFFLTKMISSNDSVGEIGFKLFGGLFFFGCVSFFAIAFLVYIFEDFYISIYKHFSHKSKSYLRFKELKDKLDDAEKNIGLQSTLINPFDQENIYDQARPLGLLGNQNRNKNLDNVKKTNIEKNKEVYENENSSATQEVERRIVEKLNKISEECRGKYSENTKILINLSTKKVWRDTYQKDVDTVNKNCDFIKTKIKSFEKELSQISNENQENFQMQLKIMKVFENSRESSIIYNLKNNSKTSIKKASQKSNIPKILTSKAKNQVQQSLFNQERTSLENVANIPKHKKRRMSHEGIIKASPAFYRQLADRKMLIGEKGELLVMEFEKKRLKKEEGNLSVKLLEHTSKSKGDGYGYDIKSFENQNEIFIEVKTTTGNFLSGLFFTNRELDVMNKLEEQYYLYRVFEFDEIKNEGRLYIFRGKQEIISYFDFKPDIYKLEPKENS